jgi:Na+/H+ antiporter
MQGIELIVALLLASTVLAGVARAIHVHYAIVLVLGGLAVGLVSGTSAPQVDPHTVLFVFLPPLIYAASFGSSTQDLRAHARAIGLLAVGLVLLSMTAVAAVAHAVAGIGWGPALVLGAILGPTDPIAATSVLRRLGAPARISTILEGEALINDGTGLTVYQLAVAAVVSGHFSPGAGIVKFIAVAAGGVAVGLAAGWISVEIRKRIDEPQIEISISLLTAYLAYIPADRIGASGVLAAVAAGLYTGGRAGSMLSPTSRLRTLGFWEALTFLLESVLFLLIGLELPHITRGLSVEKPLLYSAAVLVTLIAVRMAWMFTVPLVAHLVRPRRRRTAQESRIAERIVLGWSAMRGGVSLAAALALPLTAAGRPFPDRANVIFISYIAIAATLVIPGLTLSPLVRRLGLGEDEAVAREEARARVQLAHAALKHIEDLAEREQLAEPIVDQLRTTYELRIHRLEPHADGNPARGDEAAAARRIRELRRELIGVERRRLAYLRRRGQISAQSQRQIEHELDLEESRLAQ